MFYFFLLNKVYDGDNEKYPVTIKNSLSKKT